MNSKRIIKKKKKNTTKSKSKKRPLSNLDVYEFLIKYTTELYALAKQRKMEGSKTLANYVLSRSSKKIDELLQNTWQI